MVSAPSRQALGCPACGGSFVVHLFFSDFADESHKPGRCPWCGHHGTAPTGTIATPASFIARGPATADGDLARALSSTCPGCGAFIVDDETSCPGCGSAYAHPRAGSPGGHPARTQETAHDSFALERRAWQQRLTEPDRLKLAYTADCGHLTVLGDGSAELREREDTMYSRGQVWRPAPLQIRIWRGRVWSGRARRIAILLVGACIPVPAESMTLLPGEYPESASVVHPDATLGVLITHGVKVQWPQLADAASMLAVICRELQASSPATTVPNTAREPVAQVVPVARIIPEPVVPVVAPARRGPVTPVSPVPPSVDPVPIIPDEECAACDTKSPFVSRVEERKGEIYAVYRCPSCREDFTVYSSALAAKLSAWVEQHAVASGESREALLAEVLLNPRADLPRLRFAAVVARVDPFRAELVRVQIVAARQRRLGKSASAPDFDALAYRLQSSAVRVNRWYAGIDALVQPGLSCMTTRQLEFRRGFVEGVCLTARQFVERAGSLYHLAPILDLGVTELGSASPDFFASPHLAQLRSLCLYNTGVTDADIRRLAESPHLARLAYLDVGYGHVTEAGVEALCASRCLPELRFVRLLHNACDDPNPTSDEQDGRRYGLIPSAASSALRQKFGPVPWLNDRYCSEDPPHVETFP